MLVLDQRSLFRFVSAGDAPARIRREAASRTGDNILRLLFLANGFIQLFTGFKLIDAAIVKIAEVISEPKNIPGMVEQDAIGLAGVR